MRRKQAEFMGALCLIGLMASPATAGLTGYLKLPDIPGESTENAGIEPDEIDVNIAPDEESRAARAEGDVEYFTITLTPAAQGDEHEVEYHIARAANAAPSDDRMIVWSGAAARPAGKRQHRPFRAIKPIDKSSPARAASEVEVMPAPQSDRSGRVRVAAAWDGCKVGAKYPHALLGGGEPVQEYMLVDVTVSECASEHVSLTFEEIKTDY
ncbi:hypothetical protein K3152_02920 [Qipengyuania sp. 1NDH17]|uniref:Uncharacterized protein n=1 Tax=Qipengyuania polymorpha TaxID=2867234 RepID=A0ABS7IUT8_9SPHN|nr:hypothetical protein [Qipengyuania polymorpha]MBX7457189.1 hypothetical protein [Qipengyuania polymorpha]